MGSVYLISYSALEQLSTFLPGKLIMPNVHQVTPQGGALYGTWSFTWFLDEVCNFCQLQGDNFKG